MIFGDNADAWFVDDRLDTMPVQKTSINGESGAEMESVWARIQHQGDMLVDVYNMLIQPPWYNEHTCLSNCAACVCARFVFELDFGPIHISM